MGSDPCLVWLQASGLPCFLKRQVNKRDGPAWAQNPAFDLFRKKVSGLLGWVELGSELCFGWSWAQSPALNSCQAGKESS